MYCAGIAVEMEGRSHLGIKTTRLSCLIECGDEGKRGNKESAPVFEIISGEDSDMINRDRNYQFNLFLGQWYLLKVVVFLN